MSDDSISTYEIVNLQIQALQSLLVSALSEPDVDDSFKKEMEKIQECLEDYLSRTRQTQE
jgi:hypothetical protein